MYYHSTTSRQDTVYSTWYSSTATGILPGTWPGTSPGMTRIFRIRILTPVLNLVERLWIPGILV